MNERFIQIYADNQWLHGSGDGSLLINTKGYVAFIQDFLAKNKIKSVVDMGCGDWQFSKTIDWSGIDYRGYDVVPSVIENNKRLYSAANVSFHLYSGDPKDLPAADLLIAKDVLQHLPNETISAFLPCLAKYKYALLTNCVTRGGPTINKDIKIGEFRHLDLREPPFNLKASEVYTFDQKHSWLNRLLHGWGWKKKVLLVTRDT